MPRKITLRKPRLLLTRKGLKITRPSARVGGSIGANISSHGISPSIRTKQGSFSRRGCSRPLFIAAFCLFLFIAYPVNAAIFKINLPIIIKSLTHSTPSPTYTPTPTSTLPPPPCDCLGPDLDCNDFPTHVAAQSCFDYCLSLGLGDIFDLDSDGDLLACELLP
jgi:hypothetical protein